MSEHIEFDDKKPLGTLNVSSWKSHLSSKRVVSVIVCVIFVSIVLGIAIHFGTKEEGGDSSGDSIPHYDIEQDHSDIQSMISSAKKGKFNKIWAILNVKPYLINVIPVNESYALLHYAAKFNDFDSVSTLVNYSSCDVRVQSAPTKNNKNSGGKIPEQLTSSKEIKKFLQAYTEERMQKRFGNTPVFFTTQEKGEKYDQYGLPLFLLTVSAYKKTFSGKKKVSPNTHFQEILKTVFHVPVSKFRSVQDEVVNSLYGFDKGGANILKNANSETEFYGKLIRLYTGNYVYRELNLALKREALYDYTNYKPQSNALHFGPYALMLDSVLTFWDELVPYDNFTYRGISTNVTSHYHIGMIFVYLDFVSSTDEKSVAEGFAGYSGSVFVINNQQTTPWQPRDIAKYSQYPHEREYLYPSGAEFMVTKMTGRYIYLDLIEPKYV